MKFTITQAHGAWHLRIVSASGTRYTRHASQEDAQRELENHAQILERLANK